MAYEDSDPHKGKKSHPHKRGQIKARIIGSLVRSVLTMASKKGRGGGGKGMSEGEDSASTMSPSSGYSSEAAAAAAVAAAGSKQPRPLAPTFFLSSTNSLDGFVMEVPEQVLRRYPALEPAYRGRE